MGHQSVSRTPQRRSCRALAARPDLSPPPPLSSSPNAIRCPYPLSLSSSPTQPCASRFLPLEDHHWRSGAVSRPSPTYHDALPSLPRRQWLDPPPPPRFFPGGTYHNRPELCHVLPPATGVAPQLAAAATVHEIDMPVSSFCSSVSRRRTCEAAGRPARSPAWLRCSRCSGRVKLWHLLRPHKAENAAATQTQMCYVCFLSKLGVSAMNLWAHEREEMERECAGGWLIPSVLSVDVDAGPSDVWGIEFCTFSASRQTFICMNHLLLLPQLLIADWCSHIWIALAEVHSLHASMPTTHHQGQIHLVEQSRITSGCINEDGCVHYKYQKQFFYSSIFN